MTRRELEHRQSRLFEQTMEAFEYPPSAEVDGHGRKEAMTEHGQDDRFTFLPLEVGRLTGQAFHRGPDGTAIYGLTEEPEVCGGTGAHEGQPVSSCDECDPALALAVELETAGWPSVAEDVRDGLSPDDVMSRLLDIGEGQSSAAAIVARYL